MSDQAEAELTTLTRAEFDKLKKSEDTFWTFRNPDGSVECIRGTYEGAMKRRRNGLSTVE